MAAGGVAVFAGYVVLMFFLDKKKAQKELATIGEPDTRSSN